MIYNPHLFPHISINSIDHILNILTTIRVTNQNHPYNAMRYNLKYYREEWDFVASFGVPNL